MTDLVAILELIRSLIMLTFNIDSLLPCRSFDQQIHHDEQNLFMPTLDSETDLRHLWRKNRPRKNTLNLFLTEAVDNLTEEPELAANYN